MLGFFLRATTLRESARRGEADGAPPLRAPGPVACSADFVQLLAPTALLSEELGYGSFVAAMARTLTQGVDGEDDEGAEGAEEAEDAAAPPPEEERGDDPRERARRLQQRRRHACGAARRADRGSVRARGRRHRESLKLECAAPSCWLRLESVEGGIV